MMGEAFTIGFSMKDEQGQAIADAVITVNSFMYDAGEYILGCLPAGLYDYQVHHQNYMEATGSFSISDEPVLVSVVMTEEELPPPEIPDVLGLDNTTVAGGQEVCFNALQTITTGGGGKIFWVENGAFAELIAGINIRMLEGTSVMAGGTLHARITTDGTFCDPAKQMITMAPVADFDEMISEKPLETIEDAIDPHQKETPFRVYPNPTTGLFTLEFTIGDPGAVQTITVEIIGLRGERIMREEVTADQPHVFSLSGRQPGIYIIRVVSGEHVGFQKIIKR